jgi:hypothetical protein
MASDHPPFFCPQSRIEIVVDRIQIDGIPLDRSPAWQSLPRFWLLEILAY